MLYGEQMKLILDKFGNKVNKPIDCFNHLMDAMRYALEKYITGNKWIY